MIFLEDNSLQREIERNKNMPEKEEQQYLL